MYVYIYIIFIYLRYVEKGYSRPYWHFYANVWNMDMIPFNVGSRRTQHRLILEILQVSGVSNCDTQAQSGWWLSHPSEKYYSSQLG